jgi:hypothetical protein
MVSRKEEMECLKDRNYDLEVYSKYGVIQKDRLNFLRLLKAL